MFVLLLEYGWGGNLWTRDALRHVPVVKVRLYVEGDPTLPCIMPCAC
jgi:hypothetical protein